MSLLLNLDDGTLLLSGPDIEKIFKSFHHLASLDPTITGWYVRLKVVRCFRRPLPAAQKILGLILSNEHGMMIEAVIGKKFSAYYDVVLEQGDWVTIMNFGVILNSELIRATDHKFKTVFLESTVLRPALGIPANPVSSLVSFSDIMVDKVDTSVLVGVVGAIHEVGDLENVSRNRHNIDGLRLTFKLKDRDGLLLECVATQCEALDFERNYRQYTGVVVVAVLGWWKVDRFFDGPRNLRLCTHGPVSTVFPDPNILEALEIEEMVARNVENGGMNATTV
ncbi:uncharacterized protein LOC111830471 [Capsella rubella]|uniref:uncharacterized protein LOC111830471 n=1 Tax=Capsella rubella TaxID=81985 RepID=UPI000CD4B9F2|nr:uncharacterized protein LOC111830471 [Capsella rubella]